jgi:phosphatidylglycerol:prolipoprotein diacylglycerol transferase
MRPILFSIGHIGVPAFFLMIMVGTLAATFYGYWLAKREHADPVVILDFGIIGIIASVIGTRLFHIIIENPAYYWEKPIRVFYFWQGGFVSIGAFVFTAAAWLVYLRVRKLETWRYFDIAAVIVPVTIFFVRLGCLLAGCCYGKPTDFFIRLTFRDAGSAAGYYYPGVPLHATQPYFMLNAVIMGVILYLIYRYRKFHGQVLASFLIYYGISRFFIEFLRGDADRGLCFGGYLSTGQIAMIFSFCAGVFIYIVRSRKRNVIARS